MKTTFIVIYTIVILITYIFIFIRLNVLDNKHYDNLKCKKLKNINKLVNRGVFVIMLIQYVISLFILLKFI